MIARGETLSPEVLPLLFEPLSPAVRERNRRRVGLGLYIVQRLVTRLGGEVGVVSQLGMGSTFTVRLPRLLHRGDAVVASQWVMAAD